ncbi:6-phosphogluconolactonase [Pseudomonadota bacterium]
MKVRIFHSEDQFIEECIALYNACRKNTENTLKVALSGGSSPKNLYKALSTRADSNFEHTEFFQVDERYVPRDDDESNYKLINETLLSNSAKKEKAFHFFDTSLPIEESLATYEKEIEDVEFDLCILGVGQDFHTASLFPNSPALKEERPVAHTQTEEYAVKDRLTITFPQILKSKHILVLLIGLDKNKIEAELTRALAQVPRDTDKYPALRLLDHPDLTIFHLL